MRLAQLMVVTSLLLASPAVANAVDEVSVSDLISGSSELSGAEVTVVGELIGDYGFRRDGWMWTQLNGDAYTQSPIRAEGPVGGNTGVAIRMPATLGDELDPPGGYLDRGPIVRVTGVWRHHDPARQGESYLEVTSMSIEDAGRTLEQEPQWIAIWAGLGLLALSIPFRTRDRPRAFGFLSRIWTRDERGME